MFGKVAFICVYFTPVALLQFMQLTRGQAAGWAWGHGPRPRDRSARATLVDGATRLSSTRKLVVCGAIVHRCAGVVEDASHLRLVGRCKKVRLRAAMPMAPLHE